MFFFCISNVFIKKHSVTHRKKDKIFCNYSAESKSLIHFLKNFFFKVSENLIYSQIKRRNQKKRQVNLIPLSKSMHRLKGFVF